MTLAGLFPKQGMAPKPVVSQRLLFSSARRVVHPQFSGQAPRPTQARPSASTAQGGFSPFPSLAPQDWQVLQRLLPDEVQRIPPALMFSVGRPRPTGMPANLAADLLQTGMYLLTQGWLWNKMPAPQRAVAVWANRANPSSFIRHAQKHNQRVANRSQHPLFYIKKVSAMAHPHPQGTDVLALYDIEKNPNWQLKLPPGGMPWTLPYFLNQLIDLSFWQRPSGTSTAAGEDAVPVGSGR
jgi:hypothetical protein